MNPSERRALLMRYGLEHARVDELLALFAGRIDKLEQRLQVAEAVADAALRAGGELYGRTLALYDRWSQAGIATPAEMIAELRDVLDLDERGMPPC